MVSQSDIHNELSAKIMRLLLEPIRQGGTMTDVLVLLESVVLGTALAGIKLGGDEIVLDRMMDGVKARLAEHRLGNIQPKGRA